MHLVEIEVLERETIALEQSRYRVGGRHQEAFATVDVVDRRRFGINEVREDREVVLPGPGVGTEQDGGRAVGERRRVAGRHGGGSVFPEDRLQSRERFHAGVGPHVLILLQPQIGRGQVVEEATTPGGREISVARHRELVLLLASDLPLSRGDRCVLTHRHTGPGFGIARRLGDHLCGTKLAQQRNPLWHASGPTDLQKDAT